MKMPPKETCMVSRQNRYGKEDRKALRANGMRPIEIWVPDTSSPGFAEECKRQSLAVAEADRAGQSLTFLDLAFVDLHIDAK